MNAVSAKYVYSMWDCVQMRGWVKQLQFCNTVDFRGQSPLFT